MEPVSGEFAVSIDLVDPARTPAHPSAMRDLTGQVLAQRYQLVDVVGGGGMGTVYRATDLAAAREVAVKVLDPRFDPAKDPAYRERFLREARLSTRLAHANIVEVLDTGESDGTHFIAMELLQGRTLAALLEAEPDLPRQRQVMVDYMASRTAFFDTFFLEAARAGIRQAVILAAGLDSRAWRLPWPDGPDRITVYELDQTKVLDFKATTLADHGAPPACDRVAVAVDLRQDWPEALRQAGFDPSAPSAWSAEGLMPYLPAAAQDMLFERVDALAAGGSRVAFEAIGPKFLDPELRAKRRVRMERVRALMAELDPERETLRTEDLFYYEEREDVGDWFRRHGWNVTVTPADDLMVGYGRGATAEVAEVVPGNLFVTAQRGQGCG